MRRESQVRMDEEKMHSSESVPTPAQIGNKALANISKMDSLFVKNETSKGNAKPNSIPLVRFQQLEQEIRHAPAVAEPYIELGQIYLQQERWTDARRILDAGISYCPECEQIQLMREDLLLIQASQLVEHAKNELAQNPTAQSRYQLEQAEINLTNERIRICRDRYGRHPNQRDILITWAIALRQIQKLDEAVEKLKEASIDPNLRARASLQLGMCFQALDRPLDALGAFRKASLFRSPPPDPKIAVTALELAVSLSESLGLYDSAIYYLEQLRSMVPAQKEEINSKITSLTYQLPKAPT